MIKEVQGENRPKARPHWYAGDKLDSKSEALEAHRGNGLIYGEATSSTYASSRVGGLNLNQALTKAEGRGGPIYEFFTDDLRNRRANVNIVTQVWNYALKFFHDSFILSSFSQQWDG